MIDEADRQLMDGFEESLNQFLQLPELPSVDLRCTVMTSATMSAEVQFLAKQQLNDNFIYCLVGLLNQANVNIQQEIIQVNYIEKFAKLKEILQEDDIKDGRTIIFMNQRRRCETYSIQLGFFFGNKGSNSHFRSYRGQYLRPNIAEFADMSEIFWQKNPVIYRV